VEVNFNPEVEEKLKDLAHISGRGAEELVQDAVLGLFAELAETRKRLDDRYDDLATGRVKPISGDEVKARIRARSEARRAQSSS
jgi:hypothetical protein